MKQINKKTLFSTIVIFSLVIITFLLFFLPYFFVDEFNYIYFTYSDDSLDLTTTPIDLFEKNISRWTDVSAIFNNNCQIECEVIVQSETLKTTFNLEPGLEYGVIFPKNENISITFCGVKKNIYLN